MPKFLLTRLQRRDADIQLLLRGGELADAFLEGIEVLRQLRKLFLGFRIAGALGGLRGGGGPKLTRLNSAVAPDQGQHDTERGCNRKKAHRREHPGPAKPARVE